MNETSHTHEYLKLENKVPYGLSNLIFHRSKHVLDSSSNYAGIKDNSSPKHVNWVTGHEILHGACIGVQKNEVFIIRTVKKLYP